MESSLKFYAPFLMIYFDILDQRTIRLCSCVLVLCVRPFYSLGLGRYGKIGNYYYNFLPKMF